ncbi:DUF4158 domain-containing protein [Streptomyces sp. NPDC055817]
MAFLTDEQRRNYGTFVTMPEGGQLAGYFLLDRNARRRAMVCRGARSQLGYAVQLGTVRFLGTFLDNPEDAPAEVVEYVGHTSGDNRLPASVMPGSCYRSPLRGPGSGSLGRDCGYRYRCPRRS